MTTEGHDTTGTITDISNDRCAVLVRIGGKEDTLFFTKECLYLYGFQCEGDMTNILDLGAEVNVCYRHSKSRNNPSVLAVWIGDKPDQDTLISGQLEAMYGQEGRVDEVLDDANYLASGDNILATVFINKDVVYKDGCPSSEVLSVGEHIIFDALPSESALPSGARYQATCAWIGSRPRIVDRFGLSVKETTKTNVEFIQTHVINGTVCVTPNDVVAIVKAEVDNVAIQVILFRSSFSDKPGRIQEIVKVGERIRMRLRFAILFHGKRQWFAVKAWIEGEEVPVDDQSDVDGTLTDFDSLAFNSQNSVESSSAGVSQGPSSPAFIASPATLSCQLISGAGNPSAFGNRSISRSYPEAAMGSPAPWLISSNSGMYPTNPVIYPYYPAAPIGMVGLPVGRYGYPCIGMNPSAYAPIPSAVGAQPFVQAGLPVYPSNAMNLPAAESTSSKPVVQKPASPIIDPSISFPVVALTTPDGRFSTTSRILYRDPPLTGTISAKPSEKFPTESMISYGNIVIATTEKDIYINQRQCTREQFVTLIASGKTVVNFESVLKWPSGKRPIPMKPTHLATCVWLGQKPTMLDLLSDMYQPDMSLLGKKDIVFFGRVKKFCLPDIALVELKEKKSTVCVHVNALRGKYQPIEECVLEECSIFHYMKLRQWLSFRIVSVAACPIVLTGIDVTLFRSKKEMRKARTMSEQPKDDCKISSAPSIIKSCISDSDDSSSDHEIARSTVPSAGSNAENVLSLGTAATSEIASAKTLSCLKNVPNTLTESDTAQCKHCYQATVFMVHSKPQGVCTRLLNWSGTMRIEREDGLTIYKIERVSGLPCNLLCTPKILEFCRQFQNVFAEHDGLGVKFNAEYSFLEKSTGFSFNISRIWWDSSISGIDMLHTDVACDEDRKFEHNVPIRAVVTSVTQHDAAVAVFDDTPITVPFEALRLNVQYPERSNFSSVDHYLKIGDEVILNDIKKFYFPKLRRGAYYGTGGSVKYVAGGCWRAVKIGPSQWDEIKMPEAQEGPSWLDKWLCGEFSREERVVKKGDRYYVDFVSTKIENLKLSLDVFEHSKFFVNGESEAFELLSNLENREIKFHVAHRKDPQNSDNNLDFFVKYAWIGDDPYYLNVLKDELEVPDGLVVDDWNYVAVIEDFVLPTHMICKIGVVPVVVPFPQVAQDVSEVGFLAETSLRCKSQVVVKVRETFYKGLTFLESDSARKKETVFDDNDVLIACKGEVIVPPRPEGIIRPEVTKTAVCFHLCSVLPEEECSLNRNERFDWFKHLKSSIKTGTKVCFSAAKDKGKADYRAYKVWLE